MGLLFMIVAGAILGWLGSIVLRIEEPRGILLNIAAGIVGALLAGVFIGPLFGASSLLGANYGIVSLLLSLLGSVALVVLLNVVHRERLR